MSEKITMTLADNLPGIGQAGQRVTLALQPSDVHDATELPTYLAGYKPFIYRGDEASPPVLVDNDEDKYRNFNSDDSFRRVDVKGSDSGKVKEVDPSTTLNTYKVVNRYVGSFVPRQTEMQTGNNYRPVMAAGRRARRALDLDREIDVWTLLGTNTNFAAAQRTAVGGNGQWNDGSASNPISDLNDAINASDQPVTDIWMNQLVALTFLRHADVRDHMRQMLGDGAAPQAATRVFNSGQAQTDFVIPGYPPFHVVASKVKDESTAVLDYILGNVVVLLTVPPGVPEDGEEIATSYTFRRRGPSGTGIEVREFFIEDRGPLGGTMIVVSQADIAVMTANNAGGIITGVIV
jgi:hypothetical protein